MKTFKELLIELSACKEAIEWAEAKPIEEVVNTCHRGDWLLWLGKKIDLPLKEITLAKARCAKTVIHLMNDERSVNAIDVAERFGLGLATREELNAADAAYAAAVAADAAYTAAASAAASAAKKENEQQTADICREILGELIINKVNELLNQTK